MAVKYKAVAKGQPGVKGGGKQQYYAAVVNGDVRDIDKITSTVSSISTVSGADIRAVLYASVEAITGFLSDGDIVRLGDLGTFRLSVSSKGEAAPEDVSADDIDNSRILFTPGPMLKNMLKTLQFEKEKQPAATKTPTVKKVSKAAK